MTVENPLEDRVRRIALELIEVEEDRRGDEKQHLLDEDYVESTHMTEEKARVLYEEATNIEVNEDELVNGILELFYSYRGLTEAEDESLLAASTYAVMGHILRYNHISREDVGVKWGVSTRTISEHGLDMLEARFMDTNEGVRDLVEHIILQHRAHKYESEEPEGTTSLADFE